MKKKLSFKNVEIEQFNNTEILNTHELSTVNGGREDQVNQPWDLQPWDLRPETVYELEVDRKWDVDVFGLSFELPAIIKISRHELLPPLKLFRGERILRVATAAEIKLQFPVFPNREIK